MVIFLKMYIDRCYILSLLYHNLYSKTRYSIVVDITNPKMLTLFKYQL
jgi:hypothetical protein